ncbi:DUF2786 domain-containing protein [Streptosporangium sp. NPDC023825]|uniref:DUF2786 domain-containing protein n=1 Tax=Streptosporangium sp. NPDC023825 TaxID=3154909 RepID=UPI0034364816
MGKANRERRKAKEKERKRRQPRDAGAPHGAGPHDFSAFGFPGKAGFSPFDQSWSLSPAVLAEQLVSQAVHARLDGDTDGFERSAAALVERPGVSGWRRVADRTLTATLRHELADLWQRGWQPADVARMARKEFGARHVRLLADAIADEAQKYAAVTVDPQWHGQLSALEAKVWWEGDDYSRARGERERLDRAALVTLLLQLVCLLATLPRLERLIAPPGTARHATLRRGPAVDERMLTRVRALLAKAESTEFPAEAETFTAAAQRLMAKHSIDAALLAAAAHGQSATDQPAGRRIGVEAPYEGPKAVLVDTVAAANRCRAVWSSDFGFSTVLGFSADLDAVELLFTSLLVQATTAMVHAGSRRDGHGRSTTRSFRQSFLTSYAQRIGERLAEATGEAVREAAESSGTDLLPVLAARDQAVDEAVDEMFPQLTSRPVAPSYNRDGWLSGRAAADLATLHGGTEVTG